MTKPIFTAFVVIASSLVACFGSGPTPTTPSEARVVFAVTIPPASDMCSGSAIYVGDVALASTTGYAVTWPYTPQNNNCNGNNGQMAGPQALYSFPLDGNDPDGMPVPGAFDNPTIQINTSSLTPRIVANNSGPSVLEIATNGQLEIDPGEEELFYSSSSVNDQPIAIVLDADSNTYIAGVPNTGSTGGGNFSDPNSPVFPTSNSSPAPSTVTVGLVQPSSSGTMTGVGSANLVTPTNTQMVFAELKTPVVVDGSDNFYYFAAGSGSGSTDMTIDQLTSTGSNSMLAMVDQQTWAPVGLAYNTNGVLAWTMAPPPPETGLGQVGCEIDSYDFATKQTTRALLTSKFTCNDAAVDNGDIYFTIVELESTGCNSCSPVEHGAGIGRVSLDGSTFESVALGISAQAAGPRRVYVENSVLYVVDPFTIAAIQENALDGKHDFAQ